MQPDLKSTASHSAHGVSRSGNPWRAATVSVGAFAVAVVCMIWLGRQFELRLLAKPGVSATGPVRGSFESYWIKGRWRADAHTLVCVVEYLLEPERPQTNA